MVRGKQVGSSGPVPARVMIVGEAPGADEERQGEPFVGMAGKELSRMLSDAGIPRHLCRIVNVCRVRPPNNDIAHFIPRSKKDIEAIVDPVTIQGRTVERCVAEGVEELVREIQATQPTVIIALGDTALWALTGEIGITDWRGSVLVTNLKDAYGVKVVPTYHPAAILRQWSWRMIAVQDMRRAKTESEFPEVREPKWDFVLAPTFHEVVTCLQGLMLLERPLLSVDIETRAGHIVCIGIAWSATEAVCIPFALNDGSSYWNESEELAIVVLLRTLLTSKTVRVVGQNFLFDAQYIAASWGFGVLPVFDTMIAHHVLYAGMPKSLDFLSSLYLPFHRYWKHNAEWWRDSSVRDTDLWDYNCKDCCITWQLVDCLKDAIVKSGLEEVFKRQMLLQAPVFTMMLRGVLINRKRMREISIELAIGMMEKLTWLRTVLGHDINPKSADQLKVLFYQDLGIKPKVHRKTEAVTTNKEALGEIAQKEPLLKPLIDTILDYRTLGVLRSTFADEEKVDSDDRMRCSFALAGPHTFRFSSSENVFGTGTNMQNFPHPEKTAKRNMPNLRQLFVPDEGMILCECDLDRADLQVVVWEADDKELKQMLREGVDMHLENAKMLFGKKDLSKKSYERQTAKGFIHGTNYGGSARTMAANYGLTVHQADQMQKRWFEAHPGIKAWHRRVELQLQTNRTTTNKFGYRRVWFDRIEALLPEALAWIPQSTVGIVINRGMVNLYNNCPYVQLLLQIHDSLLFQIPFGQLSENLPRIRENLLITIPYEDPLIIPVGIKVSPHSWGDCAEIGWEEKERGNVAAVS